MTTLAPVAHDDVLTLGGVCAGCGHLAGNHYTTPDGRACIPCEIETVGHDIVTALGELLVADSDSTLEGPAPSG